MQRTIVCSSVIYCMFSAKGMPKPFLKKLLIFSKPLKIWAFLFQAFNLLTSSNYNHTSVFDDLPGAKELRRRRKRDVYAAAIDILKLMLSAKLLIEVLLATCASSVILRLSSRRVW